MHHALHAALYCEATKLNASICHFGAHITIHVYMMSALHNHILKQYKLTDMGY